MEYLQKIDWNLFKQCVDGDATNLVINKILKLQEEVGELAAIWLAKINASNKSGSSVRQLEEDPSAVMEEALDVLLVTIDLIEAIKNHEKISDDVIANIFNRKVRKWARKLEKFKEE